MKRYWLFALCVLLFSTGCDPVLDLILPTITPTSSIPTLVPTATIDARPPTLSAEDFVPFVGMNNPTAAALASNSEVQPDMTAAPVMRPILVTVTLADSAVVNGELYIPLNVPDGQHTPAVLLMSTLFDVWGGFPAQLRDAGFTVLVVETRIPAQDTDFDIMLELLINDPLVDPQRIAVIGAEGGADVALIGCAQSEQCRMAVLLTPINRQALVSMMPTYNPRPLLIAASEDDGQSAPVADALRLAATGQAALQTYESAGRGAQILHSQPELTALIIQWLHRHLPASN